MLFDDAILIGKVAKARSAKGDVQINLTNITADMFCGDFLLFDIDRLKVPFKIESLDERVNSMFAKFVECHGDHSEIAGRNVYCRKEDLQGITEDAISLNPNILKGFEVHDSALGNIGTIKSIDTSTINTIIYVQGEQEILIPLAEDFVEELDIDNRVLRLHLPEGLVSVNDKKTQTKTDEQ